MIKRMKKQRPRLSSRLLHLEFAWLTCILVLFLREYAIQRAADPLYANHYYAEAAEYIIGAFAIALISAMLIRLLELERERNK